MTESHGSVATVKSHRRMLNEGNNPLREAVLLFGDIQEYGDRIFKQGGWKLIESRFNRAIYNVDGKNVLYLEVTARLEPM